MDLAKRMAEGITAKLDFDFACNRGYSFGEYHLYGIVNEILSANIDQSNSKIQSGYSPAVLARPGRGRNPEIDFAVLSRKNNSVEVAAEVKWAASSHCNVENVLNDLLRLQLIANSEDDAACIFLLSGPKHSVDKLFKKEIFKLGTQSMLIRPGQAKINQRTNVRKKIFSLVKNRNHQDLIDGYLNSMTKKLPKKLPDRIKTSFTSARLSAVKDGRFHSYAWKVHPDLD